MYVKLFRFMYTNWKIPYYVIDINIWCVLFAVILQVIQVLHNDYRLLYDEQVALPRY